MRHFLYRALLVAHPRPLRREFGRDMELAFDALCREQGRSVRGRIRLYLREAVDQLRSGLQARRRACSPTARRYAITPAAWSAISSAPRTRPVPPPEKGSSMRALLEDLRFAVRALAAKPGFTVVAAFTLALGIGATTLIFSVTDAVMFRPLPYAAPDQLVMVGSEFGGSGRLSPMTPPDFLDLRERNRSFSGVAASASATLDLVGEGTPQRFAGARVSADFFRVLGVEPVAGRTFRADEEIPGNDRVAVISHDAWQRHWGADPALIGSEITLNRMPHTVVGVMPRDFRPPEGIAYQPDVDVWLPLAIDRQQSNRFSAFLWTIARLRDGVTIDGAREELGSLSAAFQREFYDGENRFAFVTEPLFDRTVGTIGSSLTVLTGAVALLLLIACANVANLSLARGADRGREIAMRSALGAGQGRVVQQLLLESILVALAGGALGSLLAWGGVRLLPLVDPGRLPRVGEVSLDLRVLAFALLLSSATGILFGLGPALRTSRTNLADVLRATQGCSSARNERLRGTLVAVQTALALMLLVGAGLLINSFVRLRNVDPGFDPDNLMTMRLYIPPEVAGGSRWSPSSEAEWEGWRTFYSQLLDRVATLPGVSAVAGTTSPPIIGSELWMAITIEGQEADPDEPDYQADNRVSPGYFRTIGATLIRGREFTRADDNGEPHAIVNEAFAERYWPGEDPIGKRFQYGTVADAEGEFLTVVGLVGNTAQGELGDETRAEFFVPFFNDPLRAMTVVARYEGDPGALAEGMRAAVWALKPDLPVDVLEPMRATMAGSITQPRFYTLLLSAFAAVAMTLAAVGIYGTMAYTVGQRTREVGVRLALGAQRGDVLRLIVGRGMKVTLVGMALGVAGALALSRFIAGFVFGIEPTDPATFATVAGVLTAIAALACYIPARRAARLDPAQTLRSD
ncbi:MAG: ABC transporter permease [Acidobacteriota bacterium]|jgi:predicted permease